jgi:cytochrome c oxidase assembly factor CtaG
MDVLAQYSTSSMQGALATFTAKTPKSSQMLATVATTDGIISSSCKLMDVIIFGYQSIELWMNQIGWLVGKLHSSKC